MHVLENTHVCDLHIRRNRLHIRRYLSVPFTRIASLGYFSSYSVTWLLLLFNRVPSHGVTLILYAIAFVRQGPSYISSVGYFFCYCRDRQQHHNLNGSSKCAEPNEWLTLRTYLFTHWEMKRVSSQSKSSSMGPSHRQ